MGKNMYVLDGQFVDDPASLGVDPRAETPMFGRGVLDRMRGFLGSDGAMRIVAFRQHLLRTRAAVEQVFGRLVTEDEFRNWATWVIEAVRRSGFDKPYIHLGVDRFSVKTGDTMLTRHTAGGEQVFIFVDDAGPLYGDSLTLSSETEFARPDGPLVHIKGTGLYEELLFLKGRARNRCPGRDPKRVETLLFPRQAFRFDWDRGIWILGEDDPHVAELGCSNAFALDRLGDLHLPALWIRFFEGTKLQIVAELFRTLFPEGRILRDLRRSYLLHDGGSSGTAGGIVPVAEVDGLPCERTRHFERLAQAYRELCAGTFSNHRVQEAWTVKIF